MRVCIAGFTEEEDTIKKELLKFLIPLNGAVEFIDVKDMQPKIIKVRNIMFDEISQESTILRNYNYRYHRFSIDDDIIRTDTGVLSWKEIFAKMQKIRSEYYLEDADFLVMLVDKPNEHNWFSAFDDDHPNNIFVHTGEWELFVSSDKLYPIAYEVAVAPFRSLMFEHSKNFEKFIHHEPIGCMNDFCEHKSEITFKLRTADICSPCLEEMLAQEISSQAIFHLFQILDEIRLHSLFFSTHFKRGLVSRVKIDRHGKLHFVDFGKDVQIELPPQQLSLYVFYLTMNSSVEHLELFKHKALLVRIYGNLSGGDRESVIKTVEGLATDASKVRSVISKIKRQFISVLGEKLAQGYYITELEGGGHGIAADRELFDTSAFLDNSPKLLG